MAELWNTNHIQRQRRCDVEGQPTPQALRFSHRRGERETQVTGDEPQGTMGRVQTARCLLPTFLCAHIFIERETSGYEAASYPGQFALSELPEEAWNRVRIFPTSLTGDVTSEIAEDDWERGWVRGR